MLYLTVLSILSNQTIFTAFEKIHVCFFISLQYIFNFSDFSELYIYYEKSGTKAIQTVPVRDSLCSSNSGDFLGDLTAKLAFDDN